MIRRLWLAAAWLGVVAAFVFSLDPASTEAPFMQHADKLVHMACYATLMFWWAQLYPAPRQRLKLALALIALGILIEWLQSFTPDRQSDVRDALANSVGILLGWGIAHEGANLLRLLAPVRS
jgi:VanZ like family.